MNSGVIVNGGTENANAPNGYDIFTQGNHFPDSFSIARIGMTQARSGDAAGRKLHFEERTYPPQMCQLGMARDQPSAAQSIPLKKLCPRSFLCASRPPLPEK